MLMAKNRNPQAFRLTSTDQAAFSARFPTGPQSLDLKNVPELQPYQDQIDAATRIQSALNFCTGKHRPWSMHQLHVHVQLTPKRCHERIHAETSRRLGLHIPVLRQLLKGDDGLSSDIRTSKNSDQEVAVCYNALKHQTENFGRYQTSYRPMAMYAFTEAAQLRQTGSVSTRPSWDQSFYTPSVMAHEIYHKSIKVKRNTALRS